MSFTVALSIFAIPLADPGQLPRWRTDVGFTLISVGFVVVMIGLVHLARRQAESLEAASPGPILERVQRRRATAQVRLGAAPRQPWCHEVTLTATTMAARVPVVVVLVGLAVSMSGAALGAGIAWLLALTATAALSALAGAVVLYRDARLANRWLREHHQELTPHS